ncbi:lipoate--protein ligase family protein [Bifidobacterium oedipodis]|uniref:lipoate--protein ligase family protein n=1 Tax=Bifidobacterium oedipodis TaxID=2675322 RepID=UPI003AA7C921
METMRGKYKTPGGKLVAVNVVVGHAGQIKDVHVDGDFFIDAATDAAADALLRDIERALVAGERVAPVLAVHKDAHLIGTDAYALETAFSRACAVAPHASVQAPANPIGNTSIVNEQEKGFAERWDWLNRQLTVLHDVPRMPAEQMELDETWAREVACGTRKPTLRIWEWAGPAVVIGRFQSVENEVHTDVAASEGIDIVRRCTGGGAMFIEPGNTITYSLYAPMAFVEGISIEESYRLCDWWLVGALRELGLDVRFAGLNDIASQYGKIGGAAQRRFPSVGGGPGAVLHHVTMAYDIDGEKMGRVLNTSREKMNDKAVKSAIKRVDPMKRQTGLSRQAVIEHLLAYLSNVA